MAIARVRRLSIPSCPLPLLPSKPNHDPSHRATDWSIKLSQRRKPTFWHRSPHLPPTLRPHPLTTPGHLNPSSSSRLPGSRRRRSRRLLVCSAGSGRSLVGALIPRTRTRRASMSSLSVLVIFFLLIVLCFTANALGDTSAASTQRSLVEASTSACVENQRTTTTLTNPAHMLFVNRHTRHSPIIQSSTFILLSYYPHDIS